MLWEISLGASRASEIAAKMASHHKICHWKYRKTMGFPPAKWLYTQAGGSLPCHLFIYYYYFSLISILLLIFFFPFLFVFKLLLFQSDFDFITYFNSIIIINSLNDNCYYNFSYFSHSSFNHFCYNIFYIYYFYIYFYICYNIFFCF